MAYPILAPTSTWFIPNITTITRSIITEIEIMDSYSPDKSVTIVDSWDASEAKDGSITCYVIGTKLIIAGNGSGKIAANINSSYLFCDVNYKDLFKKVVNLIGAEILDVSNAVILNSSFNGMSELTNIDLSNWNTSNVTSIRSMFNFDYALTSLNVSNWDISKVTDISFAFQHCERLKTIDVSNWDVSKVTEMDRTFAYCSALNSIDVSKWKTNNVTMLRAIFRECQNLAEVNVANWNVEKVTNMTGVFMQCIALTALDLSAWDVGKVSTMADMFNGCTLLSTIGNISKWNTSSCTSMGGMFSGCGKLSGIDVSKWDVSMCTNLSFMFHSCSPLKEIDVSKWDVSNVTNFDHFAAHANLKRKGIEKWNTSSAINMNAMFHNTAEEELDLSGYDVSNVKYFCQMFENSPNLKRVKGLEKWDTSSGVGFDEMFERCYKLEEVDLSNFDTSKAKNGESASTNGHTTNTFSNMFKDCNNLKKITLGPKFSINGDGTNTSATKRLIFPTPSATYIQEADGNWYDIEGNSYAPDGMLDKTAKTYYAVLSEAFDSDTIPVMVNRGSLTKVAHALRKKTGKTGKMKLNSFSEEIDSFEGEMLVLDDNTTIEAETLIIGGV